MSKNDSDNAKVVGSFTAGSESEVPELEDEFDADDPDYEETYVQPAVESLEPKAESEEVDPAGEQDEKLSPAEKNRRELQSRADKAEQEIERLKAELAEAGKMKADYESIKPLLDLIDTNEKARNGFLDVINSVNGGQATEGQSAGSAAPTPSLEKPERPVKPASYNRYDALNDPDSESARYDAAKEAYLIEMAEFGVKAQEQAQAEREAKLAEERRVQAERDAEAALERQWLNDLVSKHGMSQADAAALISEASSMDIASYQAMLVNEYRRKKGESVDEVIKSARREELQQEAKRRNAPVSAAAVVGAGAQVQKEKESFLVSEPAKSLVGLKK